MGASQQLPGGLSIQEHKFVNEVVKDGNASRAMGYGYPNMKPVIRGKHATSVLKRPRVQKAIVKKLDEIGLTEEYIAENIKELVESGKGNGAFKQANANTSKGALELAIKMRERLGKVGGTSYKISLVQEVQGEIPENILKQRNKASRFFNQIIQEAETLEPEPPSTTTPPKQVP